MRAIIDCYPRTLHINTDGPNLSFMVRGKTTGDDSAETDIAAFFMTRDAAEDLVAVLGAYLRRTEAR